MEKINKALEYYNFKSDEILKEINFRNNLSIEEIIDFGEQLSVLESKITALEVAKEN